MFKIQSEVQYVQYMSLALLRVSSRLSYTVCEQKKLLWRGFLGWILPLAKIFINLNLSEV